MKVAKVEPYGAAGAGLGKLSPPGDVSVRFVGRNVPEARPDTGSAEAAASDNVSVTLLAEPLPQSDIGIIACPVGLTSSTSTSLAQVWFRFRNVSVTLLMVPPNPLTLIVEGYGVAAPESGIVIAAELVNDRVPATSADTVTTKLLLAINWPSLTETVMVAVPV